eukprot:jgi/Bigna1/126420/aug1.2_g1128
MAATDELGTPSAMLDRKAEENVRITDQKSDGKKGSLLDLDFDDEKQWTVLEAKAKLAEDPENFTVSDIAKLSIVEDAFNFVDREDTGELLKSEISVGIEILLPTLRDNSVASDEAKAAEMINRLNRYLDFTDNVLMPEKGAGAAADEIGLVDHMVDENEDYEDLPVFVTFCQLKKILNETLPKLEKDEGLTLYDMRVEYTEALKLLMKDAKIVDLKSSRAARFYSLILDYLQSLEDTYKSTDDRPWLFTRIAKRIGLVLLLPALGAYFALRRMRKVGKLCRRCRCSCKGCLKGWFLLAMMPLVAVACIAFGYGAIVNIILYNIAIEEGTGTCELSPMEGYLPILLVILLSDAIVGLLYSIGSDEDKPFTEVYFDKTDALFEIVNVHNRFHTLGGDGRESFKDKMSERSAFEVIQYLNSKTDDISHYQIILVIIGIIGAVGHSFIPGGFRVYELDESFACDPSDNTNLVLVTNYVVVSMFAVSGLMISFAILVENSLDLYQQVILVGAMLDSTTAQRNRLKIFVGIKDREGLLGWMIVRDYIIKQFKARTKKDVEIVNPLAVYLVIIVIIVFLRLLITNTVDIIVLVGTWDAVILSIFILAFIFPALFINIELKHEHPKAVRKVKWSIKKSLNQAVITRRHLEDISDEKQNKNSSTIKELDESIEQKQAQIELMEGALTEIQEADVEAKLLGFQVTESLLAQAAAGIATGISAISTQLSDADAATGR